MKGEHCLSSDRVDIAYPRIGGNAGCDSKPSTMVDKHECREGLPHASNGWKGTSKEIIIAFRSCGELKGCRSIHRLGFQLVNLYFHGHGLALTTLIATNFAVCDLPSVIVRRHGMVNNGPQGSNARLAEKLFEIMSRPSSI
jgi:hypothetical protein